MQCVSILTILVMQLFFQTTAVSGFDNIGTSPASKTAPYPYHHLIGDDGTPTALFIKLKEETDPLVKQARLAPEYYRHPDLKIHHNGDCRMSRKGFDTRQALAIASHVNNQEEYTATYYNFHTLYHRIMSQLPALMTNAPLEEAFQQRRKRDQYWRGEKWKIEKQNFSSPTMEYIFANYKTYATCLSDKDNKIFLKKFIEKNGWPSIDTHGPIITSAAWLFTQHADHDTAFQSEMLMLMQAGLNSDYADRAAYAYLYDRVAINSSRPQRYGTQVRCKGGVAILRPLENEALLGELREEMYLQPIEAYLALFTNCPDTE